MLEENVTVRVNRFNIKDPVPTYDALNPFFQTRYDIQVWNELIASINYAIGTYTNNPDNYIGWNPSYLCWARFQIFLLCFGIVTFIIAELGITLGLVFNDGTVKTLSIVGFVIATLCAALYIVLIFHLKSIKREFAESLRPLIQNALNLLNTKYNNQCLYTISKLTGSAQFDLGTSLICKINIKLLAQKVNYIQQQIDGDGQSQIVVVQTVKPYHAPVNEGADDTTNENAQKPLVYGAVTMR